MKTYVYCLFFDRCVRDVINIKSADMYVYKELSALSTSFLQ